MFHVAGYVLCVDWSYNECMEHTVYNLLAILG